MIFSWIVGPICLAAGIWGWYEKSTATILGLTTWKVNLFLGVLNLALATSGLFTGVPL